MGYQLAALIGARNALAGLAATLPDARVVDLRVELALLPLTTEVRTHLAATADESTEAQPVRGFEGLTGNLARLAEQWSATAPLLHAECETWGGPGWQAAIAWRDGIVSLGPVLTTDPEEDRKGFVRVTELHDRAINTGLRHLGVHTAPDAIDEFETVGLGRHRHTHQWA